MAYVLEYTELLKKTPKAYLLSFKIINKFDFITWLPISNTYLEEEAKKIILNDWMFKKLAEKRLPDNSGTFYREIGPFITKYSEISTILNLDEETLQNLIAL